MYKYSTFAIAAHRQAHFIQFYITDFHYFNGFIFVAA